MMPRNGTGLNHCNEEGGKACDGNVTIVESSSRRKFCPRAAVCRQTRRAACLNDKFIRLMHDAQLGLHVELLQGLVVSSPSSRAYFLKLHRLQTLNQTLGLRLKQD